jgi:hypothetical protein
MDMSDVAKGMADIALGKADIAMDMSDIANWKSPSTDNRTENESYIKNDSILTSLRFPFLHGTVNKYTEHHTESHDPKEIYRSDIVENF